MLFHRSQSDQGDFSLRVSRDPGTYVVEVYGELDAGTAGLMESTIQYGEDSSARKIIVDLSGVEFVASDVMEVLVDADARSRDNGHRLVMLRAPNHVHRVFERSGLAARLQFID